ncbi:MAG: preprotein translocase subunit SecG [Pseudoxanthomonas sp.]|nr:preprotein translocase subunit SecG [Pseudoxanthomonas sp.]WDS36477.1 MAG: preprotein translocase subunit SecG [Pseudoxanthomonas sp.]
MSMLMLILNVVYVLVAIAIIGLVLMQRGSGAQAGSGFGAGASGTVFGSRGASNFLSKSTKWLAVAFFAISLFMAWNASRTAHTGSTAAGSWPDVRAARCRCAQGCPGRVGSIGRRAAGACRQ